MPRRQPHINFHLGPVDEFGQTCHDSGMLDEARRQRLLAEIHELDREVTLLQDDFSLTLGANARWIRNAAFVVLGTASLLLWAASLGFGWRLHQRSVAAEIALAHREQRLRALMDSTADGIISIGPDTRIDAANRAAARMFGCDATDLHHRTIEELTAPEDREAIAAAAQSALKGDLRNHAPGELSLNGQRADDRVFPMEIAFTRQENTDETRLIVTLRDITERRVTEAQLFQAQKMEAVGQLTGGIAHDFNNLLTVVIGNLEVLGEDWQEAAGDEQARRLIHGALSAAERGARLTSHLLAFSRRQPLAPRPVDVDALIAGLRELFDQSITETVVLGYRLNSRGWHAMVDPVQLESALLNLVINARQAMPDGGSLTIETRQLARSSLPDAALDLVPGEYLMIRVSDTGGGIPPEHRDKVFEPFFTTKEVGQGSGLGLSMVHGFVKQSGGGIRLDSRVGEGTTIELFLPGVPARQEPAVAEPSGGAHEPGARILVVEDDPTVRTATVDLLDSLGHRVVEVEDGAAALDLLEKDPAPDLVLSDVVLPCGMDGYALASQVRMRHPGVRVLLMSGYPRDLLAGADHSEIRLLPKPFTREQLQQAIGETMAHSP